jgi:C4-dicarboxylate transporter DctQ subunit
MLKMKKFLSIFDRLMDVMAMLAGVILVFIMLFICLEVILRDLFNYPIVGVTQITECLLLYITFLGSAWLLREEGHVKVDILIDRLNPKAAAFLGIIGSVIGIIVSVILTFFGFSLTWYFYRKGLYTPTILELPLSLIIIIIPIGSLMLIVQFIRRTCNFIAGCFTEMGKSGT